MEAAEARVERHRLLFDMIDACFGWAAFARHDELFHQRALPLDDGFAGAVFQLPAAPGEGQGIGHIAQPEAKAHSGDPAMDYYAPALRHEQIDLRHTVGIDSNVTNVNHGDTEISSSHVMFVPSRSCS